MFKGFKKFILRGNVVDLAVAVSVGAAFNAVVQSMVKDMINPFISIFTGRSSNLVSLTFTLRGNVIRYGDFLNSLVSFFIITVVVFFFVVQPLNRLTEITGLKKDPDEKKCPECLSKIPKLANKCKFCGSIQKSKKKD